MSELQRIALLGPRAAGKSTIGERLAALLAVPYVDLDREIEAAEGQRCAELLRAHGEAWFRERELEALERVCARGAQVLATGGGVVTTERARELLRERYRCFALLASPACLAERVRAQGGAATRPGLTQEDPAAEVEALLRVRLPHYLALAESLWSSERMSVEELARTLALCVQGTHGIEPEAAAKPRLKLELEPTAERAIKGGHPWVFRDKLKRLNRVGTTGELGIVFDRSKRFVAAGLYDASSPIALRVLQVGQPRPIDAGFFAERLAAAVAARSGLFDPAETDGIRLVHGESDGFPGLVLDRYGEHLVLKIYSGVWFPWLAMLRELIRDALQPRTLLLRTSRNVEVPPGAPRDGEALFGSVPEAPVEFREHGLRFEADLVRGQKTGFFLDQRENRSRVGALARGRAVLNLFAHAGGFSVHAAAGGARSCLDVDQSEHALAAARRNFERNRDRAEVRAARHETVRADVFAWLREPAHPSFDLVIVDPPTLAQRASEKEGALRAYERLNQGALQRLRPGGILVAASCTAHVPADEFFALLRNVVRRAARPARELWTSRHPADHPARIREAHYLKCIAFELAGR
ncbi:MAG: class I SAM-dependent methyltransferase [Planctomycetes bacterium]|nr:class I SAM-dependent methyltransferase [Planctomycetota bacterium]